jgi:hypothetical protein
MIPRQHLCALLLVGLAAALAATPAGAQVQIMRYARQMGSPVNQGMPDGARGFVFCRLRYDQTRRQRKSGWWDDYPASDFNFLDRFEELTTVTIARWLNGDPGFAQVTVDDPDLFRCPFLKMQNAADHDFPPGEAARMRDYFLKGGFLWMDDNWTDDDWFVIKRNLSRILPDYPIVELGPEHPLFSVLYHLKEIPQVPSIESWRRSGGDPDEFGSGPPHMYAVFAPNGRMMALATINSDTSDSWEREGDNPEYFYRFSPAGWDRGEHRGMGDVALSGEAPWFLTLREGALLLRTSSLIHHPRLFYSTPSVAGRRAHSTAALPLRPALRATFLRLRRSTPPSAGNLAFHPSC